MSSTKKTICLHLGAHKTASTFLQHSLIENKVDIEECDVRLYTPKELRQPKGVSPSLGQAFQKKDSSSKTAFNKSFEKLISQTPQSRIVLSEENFLGFCGDIAHSSRLYKNAEFRLNMLKHASAMHEVELCVCIRSMKSFLPSIYCQHLRHTNKIQNFNEFSENFSYGEPHWYDLIMRIHEIFKGCQITVWDYDDARSEIHLKRVMAEIIRNENTIDFQLKKSIINPSINAKGIEALNLFSSLLSHSEMSYFKKFLDSGMKWDKPCKFDPWSQLEKSQLDTLHKQDIELIKNGPKEINFIGA